MEVPLGSILPFVRPDAEALRAKHLSNNAVRAYVAARNNRREPSPYIIEALEIVGIDPASIDRDLPLYLKGP